MDRLTGTEIELVQVEEGIAEASRVLSELQAALGHTRARGGNDAHADQAVLAAFKALATLTRKRAGLLRILGR